MRVTNIEPGLTRTELGGHIDNPELSAQLEATFEAVPAPLTPEDIADLIAYTTSHPAHVNLRQAIFVPIREA